MNNSISSAGKKIALFQGSFDPFTRGHQSIVNRALTIFDEVVVAVVHNSAKHGGFFPVDMRLKIAADAFRHQPRVKVVASDGLTIDVAKRVGACCLLRGVRSVQDFEYEMPIAEVNRQFSGIETMLIYTLPQLSHINSTVVREWLKHGKDMTHYLPEGLSVELLKEIHAYKPR